MRAPFALAFALALAGCGDSDGTDQLARKIEQAALAEGAEAYADGSEALVLAIRAALDGASNGITVAGVGGGNFAVDGTATVDRTAEGEAPIDATIAGGLVASTGGPLQAGQVTIATEGHVELGGGGGGHAHGGAEEPEDELTQPIVIDIAFPSPTTGTLRFAGGALEVTLDPPFPDVP